MMNYREVDGLKYIMETKEHSGSAGEFPSILPTGASSFSDVFNNVERYMNENIHKHVVAGAAGAGDGILNDHGPGHIAMVEERAYQLLGNKAEELKGYEILILLLSIHFHDVGNVFGRTAHEEKIGDVFDALGERFPFDSTLQRIITDIAMSHGGNRDGDKDTLAYVNEKEYIDGIPIRARIIASILRFADEIADDKNRASSLLLAMGTIPRENRVFHEYSKCLEPPVIAGDTIILNYNINSEFVHNKITKLDSEVYLYDEILSRVQKCLCELDYCKRYSDGFIRVSALSVTINVLSHNKRRVVFKDSFKVRLTGYPDKSRFDPISCSNPHIQYEDGDALSRNIDRSKL